MSKIYEWACPACGWTVKASKRPACRPCVEDTDSVSLNEMETTNSEHTIF